MKIDRSKKILVTGGRGMVGHALCKELQAIGAINVLAPSRKSCDLTQYDEVEYLMLLESPEYVFHLAGHVHGIEGNRKYPADVLYNNTLINLNVVNAARRAGVKKIVAMGSGCIYPVVNNGRDLREDQIWLGEPHGSERAYAHSKRLMLAHLMAAHDQYRLEYAYAISGNLYGEYDKFDSENGHVIPSLIRKFAQANGKPVNVWGTGVAVRDFTYSGDMAKILITLMKNGSGVINVGSGQVHSIKDIVDVLQNLTKAKVSWDSSKPDGQLARYYNLDKLKALGFAPSVSLKQGIELVYRWYQATQGGTILR